MTKKRLIAVTVVVLFAVTAVLLAYIGYLSVRIDKRFSGRRWRLPSTVYSDTTLLYPGQAINLRQLKRQLQRLGYREVDRSPARRGDVRYTKARAEIYLNDLRIPGQSRPGFAVGIRFDGQRIAAIERRDSRTFLPILELEPEEIAQFFDLQQERRELVAIDQVPRHLIDAVLAAEDSRFYEHHGFDPFGILRALYVNIRHGAIRQGGSTITQQLAKNYFLTPERTLSRKLNELLLSILIEFKYDKNDILEIYLNEIYLGQKGSAAVSGVGEASRFYFGKAVGDLSLTEAAVLAGLIKSPGRYSPHADRAQCRQRRDFVLKAMQAKNWISEKDLKFALDLPVEVSNPSEQNRTAPYFIDYLTRQLETLYSSDDLASLGLSIHTTLNPRIQKAAEAALENGLKRLEQNMPALKRKSADESLQGAIVVIQPKTGYILAMVGGRDYTLSQYNRIVQSRRQPGSAFKPFVYLAALDDFTPSSRLANDARTYEVNGRSWQPENFSDDGDPEVSLRTALKESQNRATVDLAMRVGLEKVISLAQRLQFTTPFEPYPSLALGAFEVVPLELARAYCVFAADGMLPYPLSLKDVADENGRMLKRTQMSAERVISPAEAFIITDILKSVVTEGTARSIRDLAASAPIAGKTGTTNDFRDAWFVGYTPAILALVWVGFDNGDSVHASGSGAALPIWAELVQAIPETLATEDFKMPAGVVSRIVCSESGLLAEGRECPQPIQEYFLEGRVPTEPCPLHAKKNPLKRIVDGIKKIFE